VRDWDTDDGTWDEADNTYSDGRTIRTKIRVIPGEESDFSWEHNRFLLGDGAVAEHPQGTICFIAPIKPDKLEEEPPPYLRDQDFAGLRARMLVYRAGLDDADEPMRSDEDEPQ
jgi:hypothetical protein